MNRWCRKECREKIATQAAEIARLTAELDAARAVPADVEAALTAYAAAVNECGDSVRAARVLHSSIAFAIDNAVADFIDVHARRLCAEAGGVWIDESDSWAAAIHDVLGRLRANEDGTVHDGRSEARQPATVGGLLATEPVGSIVEYHPTFAPESWWQSTCSDDGDVLTRLYLPLANGTTWTGWQTANVPPRSPARLVPASEADADPATRGPLPKGG